MSLEMIANPDFGPLNDKDRRCLRESLDILDRCHVASYPAGGRKVPAIPPEKGDKDITAGLSSREEIIDVSPACRLLA